MTSTELQQAISQFEASGGQVQIVADFFRAYPDPFCVTVPPIDPELVEAIRGYTKLGVCAAAKPLGKSTRTINYIAALFGIKFATTTATTLGLYLPSTIGSYRPLARFPRVDLDRWTIARRLTAT